MNKRSRAWNIYEVGLEHHDGDNSLLLAIAAMIDYATKKPTKKKKSTLYSEHDVIKATGQELSVTRYGVLQRQLGTMNLKDDDLELFSCWFSEVMLPWFHSKEVEFTYSMLCRKFPEWLEKARQHQPKQPETKGWR